MKFCDRLQKLRKENNITQEGLADKLGVSRQAVSKWESGVGYPDTEKLIMLSKIFNVSLDDLINDNQGKKNKVNEKIGVKEIIDKLLEFLSKTINMFSSMRFGEKIKCLFEMAMVILLIIGVSLLGTAVIEMIIREIFIFLPSNVLYGIMNVIEALLDIIWIVLGVIITLKIFKMRYLDYYVIIEDDNTKEKVIEKPIPELRDSKDIKVVIRDPKDSSLNIFGKIWNVCIFLFKGFCLLISIPMIILFILGMMFLVISLLFIGDGLLFNGISISLIGALIFIYLIIEFIYNIISNREHAVKRIFILFMISISMIGIGFGVSFSEIDDFEVVYYDKYKTVSKNIEMRDNLIINDIYNIDSDKIVIDDSLRDIRIEGLVYDNALVNIDTYESTVYNDDSDSYDNYVIVDIYSYCNDFDSFKEVINNLREKKVLVYDSMYEIEKVYISNDNLTKIRDNYREYYD